MGDVPDQPSDATELGAGPSAAPQAPRRPSGLKKVMVIAVALVVTGAMAASAFVFLALRGTGDVFDKMVPGTSTVYFTAYLDPALKQKLNLRGLVGHFPDLSSSAELNRRISETLDQALEESGLASADVMPWLGTQLAIVVRFDGDHSLAAVLIASKDDTAAKASLAKIRTGPRGSADTWTEQQREGTTISVGTTEGRPDLAYAFLDHVAIVAADAAIIVDVVDTSAGKAASLKDSSEFSASVGSLPKERLALVYVNLKPLVERLKRDLLSTVDLTQISSAFGQLDAYTGMGAAVSAQSNGLALDLTVSLDPSKLSNEQKAAQALGPHVNAILAFTPREAYTVLAGTGLRQTMKTVLTEMAKDESFPQLDQEIGLTDMVDHLTGDYGIEVGPGTSLFSADGALLVGTDDEAGMQAFLDKAVVKAGQALQDGFGAPPLTWERTSYNGVTVTHLTASAASDFGFDVAYAVNGGMAIIGSSLGAVQAALDAKANGTNVTSSVNFTSAMSGDRALDSGMFYVNIEAIVGAYRDFLSDDNRARFDASDAPHLAPLKAFVFTTTSSPSRVTVRFFLLVG